MPNPSEALETRIRAFEAATPFPVHEKERLASRRWILNGLPAGSVGAEIGVFRGHFSEIICERVKPRKFYLIDPWTQLGRTFGWGKEYTDFGRLETAAARDEAIARCARFPATQTVVIEDGYPACAHRIEEPLDWAYLDASHQYERTLVELRAIQNQIRQGGFILGDDWDPRPDGQHHGVFQAVQQFCRETEWEIIAAVPGSGQWKLRRRGDV